MINGVHHVSIATTDLERILAFYRDLLGLEVQETMEADSTDEAFQKVVDMRNASFRAAWLRAGNVQIEFFHYLNPVGRPVEPAPSCDAGIRHICFDVTDLQSEYRRLKAAGIAFLSEPQYMKAALVWTCYAHDPDGNVVELQEILDDSPIKRITTFAPRA